MNIWQNNLDWSTVGANGLKVGKWGEVRGGQWVSVFEEDPAPANLAQPAGKRKPRLSGPDAKGHDFIDRDGDRFNVRVRDLATWGKMNGANLANPTITVKISTSEVAGYAAYKDAETVISLTRLSNAFAGADGWYWSDSQLLVSNEIDDKYQDAKYLGEDDKDVVPATPFYQKDNNDANTRFQISDRTHRVALGANVTVTYTYKNAQMVDVTVPPATAPVKVEKTVKLHVTILRDKALADGGLRVIAPAEVNKDITSMREIYAQAGIRVLLQDFVNGNVVAVTDVSNDQVRVLV